MRKAIIIGAATLLVIIGAGAWLIAATPPASPLPSVGPLVPSPAYVVINTPTRVLFTVQITDPSVLAAGVNLLETDASGRTLATVGVMRDDGTNGDRVPQDKTFSYATTLSTATPTTTHFRVSAAFRGVISRSLSAVTTLDTWNQAVSTSGVSVPYPATWTKSSETTFENGSAFSLHSGTSPGSNLDVFVWTNPEALTFERFFDGSLGPDLYAENVGGVSEGTTRAGQRIIEFSAVTGDVTVRVFVVVISDKLFLEISSDNIAALATIRNALE